MAYRKYLRVVLKSTGQTIETHDITREPWGRHPYLLEAKKSRYPPPKYHVDVIEDDPGAGGEDGALDRGRTPQK